MIEMHAKKFLVFGSIIIMLALAVVPYENISNSNASTFDNNTSYTNVTDITVEEAWAMLTNTSDGVQTPVDVRTDSEWLGERIDTPYPEDPRHYCLSDLYNESGLQKFMSLYNGREIILYCKSGGRSGAASQILSSNNFNGTIYNMLGGITAWKAAGLPTKTGDHPPYQPDRPAGATSGGAGVAYTYSVRAVDPDNDSIKYGWDWDGDGTVDEWTTDFYKSGAQANISHSWSEPGTYYVMVKAEDNVGEQSNFSTPLMVTIGNAPDAPAITGPSSGKIKEQQEYNFVTTDPDGDDVYYYIEWGDGSSEKWIGPYASGEEVTMEHSWDSKGTYTIKAKAKDTNGEESDWGTLQVSMPKTYGYENPMLMAFEKINEWFVSITGRETAARLILIV